ncbi:hypothetical protein J2W98_004994 [Paenibacillus peoriae]|uniref:Uncharacterized protein n=1 Tax=Paenibacillus peoriae TaxID=59893 RepID=A0ABU1QMH9_9BACL|nr:hypothetical protein [Paenibacillus peoriae]
MPIELGIWKINGDVEKIHFSSMETERKLEDLSHMILASLILRYC